MAGLAMWISRKAGLSPSPCLRRVRDLEKSGIIERYGAILNQGAAGLPLSVFVQVTLERQVETALETFERIIAERPEVLEAHHDRWTGLPFTYRCARR